MLDRADILNVSLLFMAWGKSYLHNEEMLKKVSDHIIKMHKQKLFYEEDAVSEITNIM